MVRSHLTTFSERELILAANNGDLGGGEVMLLQVAEASRTLGVNIKIIGPEHPGGVLDVAERAGHTALRLPRDRRDYMRALRRWAAGNSGALIWCHGLVPSAATSGLKNRIVHIHRQPRGVHHAVARVATYRAPDILAPSRWLADHTPRAQVFENWTPDLASISTEAPNAGPTRIGFIGRFAPEKGLDVLLASLQELRRQGRSVALTLAGGEVYGSAPRGLLETLDNLDLPVIRLGWVPGAATALSHMDVLCVPSREPESFGLVAAEAMSAGVPVVATTAGALPEVLGPKHPWVARAGDAKSLALVLAGFLDCPAPERDAVVREARTRWAAHYSPSAGLERVRALLTRQGILES